MDVTAHSDGYTPAASAVNDTPMTSTQAPKDTALRDVRVKALEWSVASDSDYGNWKFAQAWVAPGMRGYYRLERKMRGDFAVWFPLEGTGQMFLTDTEAKAAAQADYEARILSALVQSNRERDQAREALADTTASLVAAISLLKRSPKSGAPSNTMFDHMLVDYEMSAERARAVLSSLPPSPSKEEGE